MNHFQPFADPFSDEALGQRTPEAIAQDDRQAADFGGHEPTYHAALQELAKIEGLAKINTVAHFVAAVFGKTFAQVIIDSVDEAPAGVTFGAVA